MGGRGEKEGGGNKEQEKNLREVKISQPHPRLASLQLAITNWTFHHKHETSGNSPAEEADAAVVQGRAGVRSTAAATRPPPPKREKRAEKEPETEKKVVVTVMNGEDDGSADTRRRRCVCSAAGQPAGHFRCVRAETDGADE
uniref:Uncharacterized protein n=1 Tax=Oryza nivara TaxID=4536 RepID=A0A0E0I3Y7_ORYNI